LWSSSFASNGAVVPLNYFLNGFAYSNCQSGYNSIVSDNYDQVPLERTGSAGTAAAHWENDFRPSSATGSGGVSYPGVIDELMVGTYSSGANRIISDLSLKVLVDFGYEEVTPGTNEGVPTLSTSSPIRSQQNLINLDCTCNDKNININLLGTIYKLDNAFFAQKVRK